MLGSIHRIVKTPGNLNNDIGCPLSLLGIDDETAMAVIRALVDFGAEVAVSQIPQTAKGEKH